MFYKEQKLKTETLKFVAKIMINTRERLIRRHEMIKNKYELSLEFRRVINSFHDDVKLAVRVLNGLPILDDSFVELGYLPVDPLNSYAYKSILWEGSMNTEPISSNIYKGRFIMNMLLTIDKNIAELVREEIEAIGKKKNDSEAISLIFQIRDCIGNFINAFADNKKDYRNELRKLSELISRKSDDYHRRYHNSIIVADKQIDRMIDMLHPGFLDGQRPSDDIIIQNLLLIGYVMATGTDNVKNTLLVPDETTLKDKESIKALIEVLGGCILKKRNSESPYPEVYRWFIQSLPKFTYKYPDVVYNKELVEGCRALSFVNFYAGNISITRIISKMIY